jgi:hypothetical protein
LIVDNLDFIYELNILGATYSDEMKRKYPMTFTCAAAVTEKSQDMCWVYLDMNGIAIGSTIKLAYEVIIPMTTFNIFARIRYLPSFFGVWILEIVPTSDNMVCKVLDYNRIAVNTCTANRKDLAFNFYNVNNIAYFGYTAAVDRLNHWIQFQERNYQIRNTEFYSASSSYSEIVTRGC